MRAPGWYPTPSGTQERYWDGSAWSDQTRQVPRQRAVVIEDTVDPVRPDPAQPRGAPQPQGSGQPSGPPPPLRPRGPRRFPRLAGLVSVLPVLLLLPVSIACAVPLLAVVAAFFDTPLWMLLVGWLGFSLVLLLPWLRVPIAWWYLRARQISPQETLMIAAPWRAATGAAGVPADRFRLRVCDSAQVCGPAVGGRTIVLTSRSLYSASPDQLTALLAHELGHHLGMHAAAPVLLVWFILPVMVLGWLSVRFAALTGLLWKGMTYLRVGGRPRRWTPFGIAFGLLRFAAYWAVFCGMGLLWLFGHAVRAAAAVVIWLAGLLATPVARLGEYEADRLAVELGYGSALYDLFNANLPAGEGRRVGLPGPATLWGSPPPLVSRVRRLREAISGAP